MRSIIALENSPALDFNMLKYDRRRIGSCMLENSVSNKKPKYAVLYVYILA